LDKNITIPRSLLYRLVDLLEYWNISEYCQAVQEDYYDLLFALTKKKQSLELHDAYSRIVYAIDDDARQAARMNYLQQKRLSQQPF